MKPEGEGRARDIRRLRRPLAGHWQGIRDAGGLQLAPQGEGGAVPHRGARKREPLARDPRFSIGRPFLNVSLTRGPHQSV